MALAISMNVTFFVMFCSMFRICHDLKIRNAIVQFIAVDVMDYFIGVKKSANLFFHDKAMHKNSFTIISNCFVTSAINTYRTWRGFDSMQTAIITKSLIVFFTKTLTKSWFVTTLNLARNISHPIWAADQMRSSVFALKHIMVLAKTFCKLRFATAFDFTGKILNAIRAPFCFHDNNIILFDGYVKHNVQS